MNKMENLQKIQDDIDARKAMKEEMDLADKELIEAISHQIKSRVMEFVHRGLVKEDNGNIDVTLPLAIYTDRMGQKKYYPTLHLWQNKDHEIFSVCLNDGKDNAAIAFPEEWIKLFEDLDCMGFFTDKYIHRYA